MDLNKLLKTQWDRAGAVGFSALGALALLLGWIGVSATPLLAEQAPYILSGGVGGVFLLGLGATLWISADLRDEWRKLDRIEAALGDGTLRWVEEPEVAPRQVRSDVPRLPASTEFLADTEPSRAVAASNGSSNGASHGSSQVAARTTTARRTASARPRAKATAHDA